MQQRLNKLAIAALLLMALPASAEEPNTSLRFTTNTALHAMELTG